MKEIREGLNQWRDITMLKNWETQSSKDVSSSPPLLNGFSAMPLKIPERSFVDTDSVLMHFFLTRTSGTSV